MACPVPLGRKGFSARKIRYLYTEKSCVLPLAEWGVTGHRVIQFSNFYLPWSLFSRNFQKPEAVLNHHVAATPLFPIHIPYPTYTRGFFSCFHFYFLCLSTLPHLYSLPTSLHGLATAGQFKMQIHVRSPIQLFLFPQSQVWIFILLSHISVWK